MRESQWWVWARSLGAAALFVIPMAFLIGLFQFYLAIALLLAAGVVMMMGGVVLMAYSNAVEEGS